MQKRKIKTFGILLNNQKEYSILFEHLKKLGLTKSESVPQGFTKRYKYCPVYYTFTYKSNFEIEDMFMTPFHASIFHPIIIEFSGGIADINTYENHPIFKSIMENNKNYRFKKFKID